MATKGSFPPRKSTGKSTGKPASRAAQLMPGRVQRLTPAPPQRVVNMAPSEADERAELERLVGATIEEEGRPFTPVIGYDSLRTPLLSSEEQHRTVRPALPPATYVSQGEIDEDADSDDDDDDDDDSDEVLEDAGDDAEDADEDSDEEAEETDDDSDDDDSDDEDPADLFAATRARGGLVSDFQPRYPGEDLSPQMREQVGEIPALPQQRVQRGAGYSPASGEPLFSEWIDLGSFRDKEGKRPYKAYVGWKIKIRLNMTLAWYEAAEELQEEWREMQRARKAGKKNPGAGIKVRMLRLIVSPLLVAWNFPYEETWQPRPQPPEGISTLSNELLFACFAIGMSAMAPSKKSSRPSTQRSLPKGR